MVGDPNWGRVSVPQNQASAPVGNSIRWGAQTITAVPSTIGTTVLSEQVVQAQTQDPYARSWSLMGVLFLPPVLWTAPGVYPAFTFAVDLVVRMGLANIQIQHNILLMAGDDNPTVGLCNQQSARFGGPYEFGDQIFNNLGYETRPFAAVGALVGQFISAQVRFRVGNPNPAGLPNPLITQLVLAPFAAGTKL